MTDEEITQILNSADDADLAEMESYLEDYIQQGGQIVEGFSSEVAQINNEADHSLSKLDAQTDQIISNTEQKIEGDAMQQALNAIAASN